MDFFREQRNRFKKSKAFDFINNNTQFILIFLFPILYAAIPIAINEKVFIFIHFYYQTKPHPFAAYFHKPICNYIQKPAYCAFVMMIMISYWITDCLPTPITSLIPVVFYPMFHISTSKCISQIYLNV
jgi:hypothetical protein